MQHTPHTIQVMFCTQYDQYRKKQEFAIIAAGIVLVALAVLLPVPRALRILLLASGGWVIVSRNFPAVMRASDTVEARKKSGMQLPAYRYEFYDDHLRLSGEGSMAIPYESIERLVEDKKYYYLFTGPDTVMMLDRGTIGSEPENFRKFLQEKTGKARSPGQAAPRRLPGNRARRPRTPRRAPQKRQ